MSDLTRYAQLQYFTLAGSGVSLGDGSMVLSSFNDIDGNPITDMSPFGDKGFMTVEPGALQQEEQISFTGVTVNLDGTTTLTGISNVAFLYPYTETANFLKSHAGGVKVIVSNTSGYYNTFANKNDDESISGTWLIGDPIEATQVANKEYVDSLLTGGAISPTPGTPVNGNSGSTQVASQNFNVTTTGTNRFLLVKVSMESTQTVTGITYNAVAMALVDAQNQSGVRVELWKLVNPTLGTNAVAITLSGVSLLEWDAIPFNNTDQTTPFTLGTSSGGVGSPISGNVTTVVANAVLVHGVATDTVGVVYTAGAGESIISSSISGDVQGAIQVQAVPTAINTVSTLTFAPASDWANIVGAVNGITSSVGSSLEVQENGVSVLTGVTTINVTGNANVTTPGAGQVDIDILSSGAGGGGGGTKIAIDTTQTSFGGGVLATAYTIPIPGGTLGTNDAIRFKVVLSSVITGGASLGVIVKYGGTTLGQMAITDQDADGAIVFGEIIADGATNAQKFVGTSLTLVDGTGAIVSDTQYDGASAVDSTVSQNLVIEINPSGATTVNTEAIIVESITSAGIKVAKTTIASADVLTLNATPVELVPAPAAGHVLDIISIVGRLTFSTTAYTTNLNLQVNVGGTAISSNSDLLADVATTIRKFALTAGTLIDANNMEITVQTGNPAVGDSDIDIYVTYRDVIL